MSYESYISTGKANLNTGYNYTLQQIIQSLGGTANPTKDDFKLIDNIDVVDPRIRTIAEYLSELGAEGYQYKYEDILKNLTDATDSAYAARKNALADTQSEYLRNMATSQESAADTIRNQYSQAIQSGISRGMQSANLLSTILGTSQAAATEAQALADERYQAGLDYQAQLNKDASNALSTSNAAYQTLMSNIRQLFNDEIQQEAAELEYNASANETNANYLANKYTADTNYANGILANASGIYNSNQSALANIISQAAASAAQDNYSQAYLAAAQAAASAASSYSGGGGSYSGGSYSGGSSRGSSSSVPKSTTMGSGTLSKKVPKPSTINKTQKSGIVPAAGKAGRTLGKIASKVDLGEIAKSLVLGGIS